MFKRLLVILMLVPLLLAACSGESSGVVEEDNALAVDAPTAVAPAKPEPTETESTNLEPTATTASPKVSGPEMECTLVSNLPEAPAELVEIFGVKENDWVQGSDTAAVTFVEYSDFQ